MAANGDGRAAAGPGDSARARRPRTASVALSISALFPGAFSGDAAGNRTTRYFRAVRRHGGCPCWGGVVRSHPGVVPASTAARFLCNHAGATHWGAALDATNARPAILLRAER